MNPSGLWRGMTRDGRIGHFKFINVEMIPQRSTERKRSDRRKRSNASNKGNSCNDQNIPQQPTSSQSHKGSVGSSEQHNFDLTSSGSKLSSSTTMFDVGQENMANLKNDSVVTQTKEVDQSNSNSRPKSVEDLLRRIGLEVSTLLFWVPDNYTTLIFKNEY